MCAAVFESNTNKIIPLSSNTFHVGTHMSSLKYYVVDIFLSLITVSAVCVCVCAMCSFMCMCVLIKLECEHKTLQFKLNQNQVKIPNVLMRAYTHLNADRDADTYGSEKKTTTKGRHIDA